jgi:hypothetical protein
MEEMACINNVVRAFVKNSNELSFQPNLQITEKRIYEVFWSWSLTHGTVKMLNIGEFRSRMRELSLTLGFEIQVDEDTGSAIYFGVGINPKKGGN